MEKPYNSFKEYMETYEIDELQAITEQGCVSGGAGGLIYYSDTLAFYDQFCDELHDVLAFDIEQFGETPTYITNALEQGCTAFKNAIVWYVAETYASQIINETETA